VTVLRSTRSSPLTGEVAAPGDKSISHRALIFGALSVGETRITGLLEGDDVLRTAEALRGLGAGITRDGEGSWRVQGVGVGGFREPDDVLDMGNSGTGSRLLIGAVSTTPIVTTFTGDASLRGRPMKRVTEPLKRMGASFVSRSGGLLPISVTGARAPMPIRYEMPVSSAQVKSAILLAGLNAPGRTSVVEPAPTRDHTERLLSYFGASVDTKLLPGGRREITVAGQPELTARDIDVAGDPSSAAFLITAAILVPGSDILVRNVGLNPHRTGLFETLREMGASLVYENVRDVGGEPVADIAVRSSPLRGIEVPAERAPSMIDEYPILCIAAAAASGTTVMNGIGELRVKESDRAAAMAEGLEAVGVSVEVGPETMTVTGCGNQAIKGGAQARTFHDHRIAMSFLVMGLASEQPIEIDDDSMIATSFPTFSGLMGEIGATFEPVTDAAEPAPEPAQ
jgi:3-phosphoshikimate 1-carboxyvinyltransferase